MSRGQTSADDIPSQAGPSNFAVPESQDEVDHKPVSMIVDDDDDDEDEKPLFKVSTAEMSPAGRSDTCGCSPRARVKSRRPESGPRMRSPRRSANPSMRSH